MIACSRVRGSGLEQTAGHPSLVEMLGPSKRRIEAEIEARVRHVASPARAASFRAAADPPGSPG